jgi:predicted DNA-binding antitoxin AbrB/MazE fold protein
MTRTIRARYRDGRFEPLEPFEFDEGKEVVLTVTDLPEAEAVADPLDASAGAWKDLLDCEQFEKDVYASRSQQPRPEVSW